MDYRNVDFMDEKVILYGHNMRDGSMFAGLKDLDVSEKPIAVVYTPTDPKERCTSLYQDTCV